MSAAVENLWNLTTGRPQISPTDLGALIGACLADSNLDFRTKVLIRDGYNALEGHWRRDRLDAWLGLSPTAMLSMTSANPISDRQDSHH